MYLFSTAYIRSSSKVKRRESASARRGLPTREKEMGNGKRQGRAYIVYESTIYSPLGSPLRTLV
jgi:hypothetical protein